MTSSFTELKYVRCMNMSILCHIRFVELTTSLVNRFSCHFFNILQYSPPFLVSQLLQPNPTAATMLIIIYLLDAVNLYIFGRG